MKTIKTRKGNIKINPVLYVGNKQIDRAIAFENFKTVSEILSKTKINWGPVYGTLLGIVRDSDFIEWDKDIDLYVLEEEEEDFKDTLWEFIKADFKIIRYERRGLYSIRRNGEYIDFYIFRKISPELRYDGGVGFIFDKYLTNTQKFNFKGTIINIPEEYDEFLTYHYGDWHTPVQWADFELSNFKIFLVKMANLIKRNLPDWLYYYILKKHHTKSFEKFKQKCIKKGCPLDDNIKLSYKRR